MGDEVWAYMTRKLNDEPMEAMNAAKNYYEKTLDGIKSGYGHNPPEMNNLIRGLDEQHEKKMEKARAYYVPKSALRKQRSDYEKSMLSKPKIAVKYD